MIAFIFATLEGCNTDSVTFLFGFIDYTLNILSFYWSGLPKIDREI